MTQDMPPMPAPLDPTRVFVDTGPPEWVPMVTVICLLIIVLGIVLFPLARAWARRLERGSISDDLLDEVAQVRERVAELEGQGQRMGELEDRVDFTERLLTEARDAARLPREGGL